METAATGGRHEAVAGLIVGDGDGQYYAIGWEDLRRYRVPMAWVAAVAAMVHGAELAAGGSDMRGHAAGTLSAEHALIIEAVGGVGRLRLAAQRLEAWALLR